MIERYEINGVLSNDNNDDVKVVKTEMMMKMMMTTTTTTTNEASKPLVRLLGRSGVWRIQIDHSSILYANKAPPLVII
jgi:hypothetical protein